MAEIEKNDNINSLCKKYFTPELCDETITDSEDTLKKNIMTQLYKYGLWCFNERITQLGEREKKTSPLIYRPDLKDDSIIDAIEIILDKGFKKEIKGFYSSYFKKVLFDKFYKKLQLKAESDSSFDEPLNEDDSISTLHDFHADRKYLPIDRKHESSCSVSDILKTVEKAYRIKQQKKYKEWLSPGLTVKLFEGLKLFCNTYGEEGLQKYTFADSSIYNLDEKPTMKSVAESLKVDDGYLKKEIDKFLLPINELLGKKLAEIEK